MNNNEIKIMNFLDDKKPRKLKDIEKIFKSEIDPEKIVKEVVWKLIEERKLKFNKNWLVEITKD